MQFQHYIALGDSLSIDLYPALDAGETEVAVALERVPSAGAVAPLGAASLLFRNDDARWPEEAGRDLASRYARIDHRNLAEDGATIGDIFGEQLPQLEESVEPTLLTLTAGLTDVFASLGSRPSKALRVRIGSDIGQAYELLVDTIRRVRPNALLVLATLYDPSDGTGRIPGVWDDAGPLPLDVLRDVNDQIRTLGRGTPGVVLADVYAHFLGHGTSVDEADRWYWRRSLVEPNAVGANEIRRAWLETLERWEEGGEAEG